MKPKFALLLFALLLSAIVFGQYRVIPQPANRVLNIDGQWRESDSRNSSRWDVVSDRNDNLVYSDSTFRNEIPNFRLSFNETVYVLDYKPGGLLVCRINKISAGGAFTGNVTTEMGWVKEKTMVLSRYSIRTRNNPLLTQEKNGLYTKKAFIFNRPGTYEVPSFYSKPSMSNSDVIGSFNIYTLFYIYKEDGDKLLLGKKPEKSSVADKNLIGWVPRSIISSWNHNMCFEENWNQNGIAERLQRGTPALINGCLDDARKNESGQTNFNCPILYNGNNGSNSPSATGRMDGSIFRSPIINTIESNALFEVGYLSRGADQNMSESDKKSFVSCFSDLLNQLNTINLVFMIDGTHSIIPYKSTIVNTMKNSIKSLANTLAGSNTKLKYSAIIYRDDPYSNRFSSLTEKYPDGITTSLDDLIKFVEDELVLPPSVPDDQPEAMFWGFNLIDKKLSKIRPFEKTFVIVIGDAASHQRTASPTYFTERLVVDLLKRKNYSVSAIQINHRTTDPAYDLFQTQYKNILTSYYREKHHVDIPSNSTECIDSKNNITRFPKKDMKLPSVLIYPPRGQSLSDQALGQQLTDLILAAPFADFKVELPCKIPPSVLTYLNISPDDSDFMRKALYGLFNSYYVPGYLTQFSKGTDNQTNSFRFFNDVQFFGIDELKNIDEQLKILIPDKNSPSNKSPRERVYNAWYNILVKRLKVVDESEFGNTTLRQASLFLTQNKGLDEWSSIRMIDITNHDAFPDNLLAKYYYDWFTTKIMVQSILGNSSMFLPNTLELHSDVYKYCYDLFHPGQTKTMTVADRNKLIKTIIDRSLNQHYSVLQYTNDKFIKNYSRCKGDIVTMTVDKDGKITQGGLLETFWVSGEYFPHENNYASEIFR